MCLFICVAAGESAPRDVRGLPMYLFSCQLDCQPFDRFNRLPLWLSAVLPFDRAIIAF